MKQKINIYPIILFYVIAVVCRFIAVKTGWLSFVHNGYVLILLRGIGPALGALAAFVVFRIPARLSLKGNYRNIILPFLVYWLLPVCFISAVYYVQSRDTQILLTLTVLVYGLLEEIGWRGFLQEQLQSLPKVASLLIITLLWFCWHLNFDLNIRNLVFLGILFFGAWGIGKIYTLTGSLIAVSAVHSLNNFFPHGVHENELKMIVSLLVIWIVFVIVYERKIKKRFSTANDMVPEK